MRFAEPTNQATKLSVVALIVALVGAAIATLSALIAAQAMQGRMTMIGDIVAVVVSLLVAYPTGVGLGIVGVKKLLHWPGSILLGIAGGFLGAVLTLVVAEPLRLNADTRLLMAVYFVWVAVGAAAGFLHKR